MQQLSATLGIAISAAVLSSATLFFHHSGPMLSDFTIAFLAMALLSLLPLPLSLSLHDDAGSELTGRPQKS
jgi:hypothetical protein